MYKRLIPWIAVATLAVLPTFAEETEEPQWVFSYTPNKGIVAKTMDGQFKFHLSNRVQMRFTQAIPDEGDSIGSFRVRRWKFKMDGYAFTHWKYKLQVNFASGSVEGSNEALLEDAYFQYTKNHWVQPFFGQGKAWFARQALTSSGKQQFVDRSIAVSGGAAEVARQIGVGVVGTDKNKKFEYNFGVYNGDGTNSVNKKVNENDEFLYVGRVVWTPFGEYKLAESALDRPESSKLAIGFKAAQDTVTEDFDDGVADPVPVDLDRTEFGMELAYKIHGFSFVSEYFLSTIDTPSTLPPPGGVTTTEADSDIYYAQAGYVFANNLEVAGRYSVIDPDEIIATVIGKTTETGAALSYYWRAHNYKIQADYRKLEFDATPEKDSNVARVQIQLVF